MTLIELIRQLNSARSLNTVAVVDQLLKTFVSINAGLNQQDVKYIIDDKKQQILDLLKSVDLNIANICTDLQEQINKFDVECNQTSLDMYNNGLLCDTPEYLFDKNLIYFDNVPDKNKDIFLEKIKTKLDWRWPAMEIRPNNGYITAHLVACDPLYLVDTSDDMFAKIQTAWNDIYQRRVRYYTINEQDAEILAPLPLNQFGLIVCADFFDRRPLPLVQKYLAEIYNKLRPGGTAFFTFNDCDYPEGIENFSNFYYCYIPGHTIIESCCAAGYIVKELHRLNGAISYLEVQKPGTLTTIRAGQAIGKIIDI